MESTKVAFLGLGLMGSGMAGRLLAAGYPLTVYNRTPKKAQSLVERGAELAKSPGDAASGKDVIFSMLADDQGCREVWLGKGGALASAAPGAILVESSTVTVEWIHELKAAARSRLRIARCAGNWKQTTSSGRRAALPSRRIRGNACESLTCAQNHEPRCCLPGT